MLRLDLCCVNLEDLQSRDKVYVECVDCQTINSVKYGSYKFRTKNKAYRCKKCSQKCLWTEESKTSRSEEVKLRFSNPTFAAKHKKGCTAKWQDELYRTKCIKSIRKQWEDDNYKLKQSKGCKESWTEFEKQRVSQWFKFLWSDPEYREIYRTNSVELWKDPEYRLRQINIHQDELYKKQSSERSIKLWQDPDYAKKMVIQRANHPRCSSIQTALYSILDDLGIKYFREYSNKPADTECIVGPYLFDCVIPREGKTTLLIECQGDYWHNIPEIRIRDSAKASYVTNNLSHQYEIKYLWEHEFKCKERVMSSILYWMGKGHIDLKDFEFSDIIIGPCLPPPCSEFLSKYHYLSSLGRGGIIIGGFHNGLLVATSVFSKLIRQNISKTKLSTRELSRFCIHPAYQKKNFASWFMSQSIKKLDHTINHIISYCDTTFNHNGAVYKACNFKLDHEVKPDYWYVSSGGWVMHKKTLYNHARSLRMTEKEFADKHNYKKVFGHKKLRFSYVR